MTSSYTINSRFAFQHAGVANSGTKIQLDRSRRSLIESGYVKCPAQKNWFQAIDELYAYANSVQSEVTLDDLFRP